jgi:4-carboxymuconolactone decarboxylase
MIIATHEERLRRLVLHDEGCIQSMLGIHLSGNDGPSLDPKTQALVRLGGLVAMGAAPVSYHWAAEAALDAGATAEEVVGALVAVAPISGLAWVISATSEVAPALGSDIDQAFETFNGTRAGDSGRPASHGAGCRRRAPAARGNPGWTRSGSSDRHKRRWEEVLEIFEALASPNWGDDTVGAWWRPSGWTARLIAMELVDA